MITAIEFLKTKNRMCEKHKACGDCPMSRYNNPVKEPCSEFIRKFPNKAIEIVEKWLKENPAKTNKDKFIEVFHQSQLNSARCVYDITGKCGYVPSGLPCNDCDWWKEEYKGETDE